MVVSVSVIPSTPAQATSLDALSVLGAISVQNEHRFGYSRELFPHWQDVDGDGCNSREQVLKRDSVTLPQVDPYKCYVVAGDWVSPYDGKRISDRTAAHIDHLVALKEAWDSGAWSWTTAQRTAFANDTSDRRSLVVVSASSNTAKGEKDPSNWLPSRTSYICTYLTNWVAVKARWKLSMDQSEHGRIRNVLRSQCQGARIEPWRAVPGLTAAAPTPSTSGGTSSVPRNSTPPATRVTAYPGAWCKPEGARGVSDRGVQYVCSRTSLDGTPYKDGRTRWRRTS
jgi:hypothetical protein